VLKRLNNLSDQAMEYQVLERMSDKWFCGLTDSRAISDRTTIWTFENRIGKAGAKASFDGVDSQLAGRKPSSLVQRSSLMRRLF